MKVSVMLGALAAASVLTLGGVALANDDDDRRGPRGHDSWMSVESVAGKLRGQGYTLLEIERDDGRYEAKVRDTQGRKFEVDLHRRTGEPLGRFERKDDDRDDDDRYDD